MTMMPEGYLICFNVPIARTGYQEYTAQEVGMVGQYGEVVRMYRPEEEVFQPEALASFEGKPVTDDHPQEDVHSSNWSRYAKGVCTKVRRGSGEDSDKVLADLLIYDEQLQSEIQQGKREVSCGYDYIKDTTEDGQIILRQIRGNHVAIVQTARAGHEIAIRDQKTVEKETKKMTNKHSKQTLRGKMLKAFAMDAEPEELADAMEIMGEQEEVVKETPPAKDEGAEADPVLAQILAKLESMEARIAATEAKGVADEDPLSGLEKELSDGAGEEEESVTLPAEKMEESGMLDATCGEKAMDRQTVLTMVKAIKPTLAGLPPEQRQKASDSINVAIRGAMGKPSHIKGDQYQALMTDRRSNLAQDSQAVAVSDAEIQEVYNKRNPHYQPKGGK